MSIGDALRDLDTKQVLKNDFVLVSGDMITNMDVSIALGRHRQIKESDKNCIMTMVMKSVGPQHRSRYALKFHLKTFIVASLNFSF